MIYHIKINLNNAIFARLISELVDFRQQNVTIKKRLIHNDKEVNSSRGPNNPKNLCNH